jgi:hypothetical protein
MTKELKMMLTCLSLFFCVGGVIVTNSFSEEIMTPEGIVLTHYPERFDNVVVVEEFGENGIYFHDQWLYFSSSIILMTRSSQNASIDSFRPGTQVGYVLDDAGNIEVLCEMLSK